MSSICSKPPRQRTGKMDIDKWNELFKLYEQGHSITSLCSVFDIGHEMIAEKLKEVGIYDPNRASKRGTAKILRTKIIPRGRFADLYK